MARQTKFSPVKSAEGWRLNVPAKFTLTGKRERYFYPTQKQALEAAKRLKQSAAEFGHQSQAIRPSLAEDASAAAALLAPWGASLIEAARSYAATRERESASKPLAEATAAWLVTCEHLRKTTLTGYKQTTSKLEAALGSQLLATITTDQLQAIVASGVTPSVAAHRYRDTRAFWRWACGKGWCQPETLDRVELPKMRNEKEIGFLTPEQAATLLSIAEKHFPQAVATYALQFYAGIRVEEISKLEARNVTDDGIELGASITKKGRRRHITPSPTLAAWLAKHPFKPCPNWRRIDRACRYLAGWAVIPPPELVTIEKLKKGQVPPPRPDWPVNGLRHSHATYAVAGGAALETLLFEFGHTGNANVLRAHYVGKASKKQALEFFAIMPEGVAAPATIQPVEMQA